MKGKNQAYSQIYDSGVALMELIIVLAVFVLILGTAVSIFISLMQNQSRLLKEQELLNQISYATEYISRLAMDAVKDDSGLCLGAGYEGYNYRLTHFDIESDFYQGVRFIAKDGTCQEFFLDADGFLKEVKNSGSSGKILSDTLEVEYARFIINGDKSLEGASQDDLVQPRITFVLDVKTKGSKNVQEKIIQTTISQKNLNVQ